MTSNRPASVQRASLRLLGELARPDAYAFAADDDASVVVAAMRKGVSLRIGAAPPAAAHALVKAGLAQWETGAQSGRARLLASDVGRAKAARLAAGAGIDPFLAQHADVASETILVDGARQVVSIDRSESPLAWLARRRGPGGKALIEPSSLQAGERLRADMTIADMLPRVTSNWSGAASGGRRANGPETFSDHVVAARQRVRRALDAAGADMAGLLIDVCGFLKGLETVESERGWPQRSARVVLTLALARLACHYGLAEAARGPERSHGIVRWGAEDYRPSIG